MKWESLGRQELPDLNPSGKGYVYTTLLWRTPVPGGWLLMAVNSKSGDPQPVLSFYPDAEHLWRGNAPPEAEYLLRPASSVKSIESEQLLRGSSDDNSKPKRLES